MTQKTLANLLKAVIIGTGLFGLIVFGIFVPRFGYNITEHSPEMQYCFWPWLIFLWLCALPCFASLFFGWKIASNIGKDNSFSFDNAKELKIISILAAADTAFFIIGNWVLLFLDMNHPGVVIIIGGMAGFIGAAVSVVCASLSHLVYKSALMQSENDLTI